MDADTIEGILHDIKQALNNKDAQVTLYPVDDEELLHQYQQRKLKSKTSESKNKTNPEEDTNEGLSHSKSKYFVKSTKDDCFLLEIMCPHLPGFLSQVINLIHSSDCVILRLDVKDFLATDCDSIYIQPLSKLQ